MKFLKRLFLGRRPEADLNQESANAALYYIEKQGPNLPLEVRTAMLNYVAIGFSMGWRKYEEKIGVKSENS